MHVTPLFERSTFLNVAKLYALDISFVPSTPAEWKGTKLYLKIEGVTITNAARPAADPNLLPRRSEPLKGTGSLVP